MKKQEFVPVIPPPPWKTAKNKHDAFARGYTEGVEDTQTAMKMKLESIKEQQIRLDALKNISQAGSSIIECMTKAMLSYDKNL